MKASEIYGPLNEDQCDLCQIHEMADQAVKEDYKCFCGEELDLMIPEMVTISNGHNDGFDPDVEFKKRLVTSCGKCYQYYSIELKPIHHNANHGVYYTAEGRYIQIDKVEREVSKKIKEALTENAEQWLDRVKKGENLQAWNIVTWITYSMEQIIAETVNDLLVKLK